MSLRLRILLTFLSLATIVISSFTAFALYSYREGLERDLRVRAEESYKMVENQISAFRDRAMVRNNAIVTDPEVTQALLAGDKRQLRSRLSRIQLVSKLNFVQVIDLDGRIILDMNTPANEGRLSQSRFVKEALSGMVQSGVEIHDSEVLVLAVDSIANLLTEGEKVGLVLGGYRVDEALLDEIEHITGFEAILYSGQESRYSTQFPPEFQRLANDPLPPEAVGSGLGENHGVVVGSRSIAGLSYKTATAPLFGAKAQTNLMLTVAFPTEYVERDLAAYRLRLAAIALASIVLVGGISLLFATRLTASLVALRSSMAEVEKGKLETRAQAAGSSEVASLARTFNLMLDTLQRAMAELREMDRMKDDFLANTSHELRSPLHGIIGLAEGMLAEGGLREPIRKNLTMIVTSGRRLANMVADILDFSKLREHSLELQIRAVQLRDVAEMVCFLSRPLIGSRKLTLVNAVGEETPLVRGDENRLQQILHNLVGNAVKFSHGGEIRIEAIPSGGELLVSVKDQGIGIPPNRIERIFNPFEQGDGSISREYGGTGLGLAITKTLVELHRGRIGVESVPGQGSTFFFTLPLAEQDVRPEAPMPLADPGRATLPEVQTLPLLEMIPSPGGDVVTSSSARSSTSATPVRILAVDDEPINLAVLRQYITSENYEMREAASGPEAQVILENPASQIDLVLLDVMMPRMSGYELLQWIRERHPLGELPVVLLTARTQTKDVVQGLALGANDYVTKPVAREELLARVGTHVRLASAVDRLRRVLDATQDLAGTRDKTLSAAKMVSHILSGLGVSGGCTVDMVVMSQPARDGRLQTTFRLDPRTMAPEAGQTEVTAEHLLSPRDASARSRIDDAPPEGEGLEPQRELLLPLRTRDALLGVLRVELDNPLVKDEHSLQFLETLQRSLALVWENSELFQKKLEAEIAAHRARFEELGRMAIRFGDSLNTPLFVISMACEEIADGMDTLQDTGGVQEVMSEMKRHLETIEANGKRIKNEIAVLNVFKEYAPSDALVSKLPDAHANLAGLSPNTAPRS